MAKNPKVDAFLERETRWKPEFVRLRELVLATGLYEDFKWGQPCYSLEGKNVVLIHGFKDYCALLFMKGALIEDPDGLLVIQTDNVQASRQIRFAGLSEVTAREAAVAACIERAMAVEKAGLKVELKKTDDFALPAELQAKFDTDQGFMMAFKALTPGRQRAYLLNFSEPKQSGTRVARIEKHHPRILAGKGLNDPD